MCVCVCVCVYLVCNLETVHRNMPVPEYSVPIVNLERSSKRNSKPCLRGI